MSDPDSNSSTRRAFIATATTALAGIGAVSIAQVAEKPKPPPLPDELVREFVGAAHGNLDRTKEMLGNEPSLLNATWDWRNGDFEAAIGGAGHMGRRDIAEFLLSQGARMDLFVTAMLGKIEIVRATLTAYPNLKTSKGPHGISLVRHAEAGGEAAKPVLEYLNSIAAD